MYNVINQLEVLISLLNNKIENLEMYSIKKFVKKYQILKKLLTCHSHKKKYQ